MMGWPGDCPCGVAETIGTAIKQSTRRKNETRKNFFIKSSFEKKIEENPREDSLSARAKH
jgi:hypothetical protein